MAVPNPPPQPLFSARFLRSLPLTVQTIVDVGVRGGTRPLYRGFPDADFLLVDPQKQGESLLRFRPNKFSFRKVALGAHAGTATFNEDGGHSSLLERTKLTEREIRETYAVDVITLDDLLDGAEMPPPYGLKIDTEGYEVEVLRGLRRNAPSVEFIICEVSIKHRFIDGYRFSDLIAEMKNVGQELYTIMSAPTSKQLFYDCLFLRDDHPLFGELT